MNWPFVSRSTHDRELAALERLLAVAEKRAEDARADADHATRLHELEYRRYDDLLSRYHALKVAGASEPVVPVLPKVPVPDEVQLAISRKAGSNQTLRTHYAQLAHTLRTQNLSDADIAAKILAGDDATAFGDAPSIAL